MKTSKGKFIKDEIIETFNKIGYKGLFFYCKCFRLRSTTK